MEKLKEIIKERKFKYIVFFCLLLAIQFIIGGDLQYRDEFFSSKSQTITSLLGIIGLTIILIVLFYLIREICIKIKERNKTKEKSEFWSKLNKEYKGIKHKKLFYFGIMFLIYLPAYLAFFPLIFNYDAPYQMYFKINSNRPMIHTLLLRAFSSFGYKVFNSMTIGLTLYIIMQEIILLTIFAFAIDFVKRKTNSQTLEILTLVFFAIFPFNQIFTFMATKDTLFAGLMLASVMYLIDIMDEGKTKIRDYIFCIILLVLVIEFRNVTRYVYFCMIPVSIIVLFRKPKLMLKVLMIFIVSIVLYTVLNKILTINMKPTEIDDVQVNSNLLIQSVAYTAMKQENNLTAEEKEKVDLYYKGGTEKIREVYKDNIIDPINGVFNGQNYKNDRKAYYQFAFELIKKYPSTAFKSMLNTNRGIWYIQDDSFNQINREEKYKKRRGCLEIYDLILINKDEFKKPETKEKYLPYVDNIGFITTNRQINPNKETLNCYNLNVPLRKFYKWLFCENNYTKIPILYVIFQPGIYLYLTIAFVLLGIYRKQKEITISGMFLLIYFVMRLFGPCSMIRYVYCNIVIAPILIAYFFTKYKNTENKKKLNKKITALK